MRVCSPRSWIIALAAIGLGLMGQEAKAGWVYSFDSINGTSPANIDFSVTVQQTAAQQASGDITFHFQNNSVSGSSSIATIYFDDKDTANHLSLPMTVNWGSQTGVKFSNGTGSPGNLPSGTNIGFVATTGFLSDASAPPSHWGLNPGEWLDISFKLSAGETFASIVAALDASAANQNLDDLRIGIHGTGLNTQGLSLSYVQTGGGFDGDGGTGGSLQVVPAPAGLILLASGLPILGLRRLLRRKLVAA